MDLTQKLMNFVLPPLIALSIILVAPCYLIFKALNWIKKLTFSENVAGKVVVVTGAAAGIGEQIAYEYAKRGACLVLVDIKEERIGPVVDTAKKLGSPDVIGISADVSSMEDCQRFVNAAIEHFGRLDHLVNNAGVARVGLFESIQSLSGFTPIMDINFWGTVYGTHFALPHLRKSKGKIVVVSSTGGWYPFPGLTIYNASKAALISFFEILRSETGGDVGITIVTPGLIRSDMSENVPGARALSWFIPRQSKEECGRAIVKSACRGDKYLVEPSWVGALFPLKVFFPELIERINHLVIAKSYKRTSHHRKLSSSTKSASSPQVKSD